MAAEVILALSGSSVSAWLYAGMRTRCAEASIYGLKGSVSSKKKVDLKTPDLEILTLGFVHGDKCIEVP